MSRTELSGDSFFSLQRSVRALQRGQGRSRWIPAVICVGALVGAFLVGQRPSVVWLGLLVVGAGGIALLLYPSLSILALTVAALLPRLEIGTGTEVELNPVTLLIPVAAGLWLLDMMRRRDSTILSTRANRPLVLFLVAGLAALVIGRAFWDPAVPVRSSFIIVQLAQWAIFAFSALAFWMASNLIRDAASLKRWTFLFLGLAGAVAILRLVPGVSSLVDRVVTLAFIRTPLWVLLVALGAGQLLFNRRLSTSWRVFLVLVLLAALFYAFVEDTDADSNWVGLTVVLGSLVWLRYPKLRRLALAMILISAAVGMLFPAIYEFAGGEEEWIYSGASRLLLIERVVSVTMRNPITGLGPAAYRLYAAMEPLRYRYANWVTPQINSHNNYVDVFSHAGLVGLGLFLWFMIEIARLGWRLHGRYPEGFGAGYVNGVLAAIAAMAVIMMMLDWFLPFVYNVGFTGFQASVLVWLFMGGLVALDHLPAAEDSLPHPSNE